MLDFKTLVETLASKGLTLSSAESFTGGRFADSVVSVPGASKVFKGAIISYDPAVKTSLLGVPTSTIEEKGVVSMQVASLMAKNGRKALGSDICVSFTGDAGPTLESKNDKVGESFIGIADKDRVLVLHCRFKGTRDEIRNAAVKLALEYLLKQI